MSSRCLVLGAFFAACALAVVSCALVSQSSLYNVVRRYPAAFVVFPSSTATTPAPAVEFDALALLHDGFMVYNSIQGYFDPWALFSVSPALAGNFPPQLHRSGPLPSQFAAPTYNLAVAPLHGRSLYRLPGACYIAARRFHDSQCHRFTPRKDKRLPNILETFESALMLLDFNFRPLSLVKFFHDTAASTCITTYTALVDFRLHTHGETILLSFVSSKHISGAPMPWNVCELTFTTVFPNVTFSLHQLVPINDTLVPDVGKNFAVFWHQSGQIYIQTWVAMQMTLPGAWITRGNASDGSALIALQIAPTDVLELYLSSRLLNISNLRASVHSNGVVLDLGTAGLLSVAHVSIPRRAHGGRFNHVRYGAFYMHFFVLMDRDPPFTVRHRSSLFCFPAFVNKSQCEVVQFVMSVVLETPDVLMITYGANDCEALGARIRRADVLSFILATSDARNEMADTTSLGLNMDLAIDVNKTKTQTYFVESSTSTKPSQTAASHDRLQRHVVQSRSVLPPKNEFLHLM